MAQSPTKRIVPTTAEALLGSHPDVTVNRDQMGNVEVMPVLDATEPFIGFSVLLHMAFFEGRGPGSALRIAGRLLASQRYDTSLRIPTLGKLTDMQVDVRGCIDPVDLIAMAREGVELFDDLQGLSPEERRHFGSIPSVGSSIGGNLKAADEIRFQAPEITAESFEAIPMEQLAYGAFAVAKRLLLEPF